MRLRTGGLLACAGLALWLATRTRSERWRLIHNCGAHPLIGVFGEREWVQFLHDWTSEKMEARDGKLQAD
jgi:hypothetical protein